LLSAIGLVESFADRDIIGNLLSLGYIFLFLPPLGGAYILMQRDEKNRTIFSLLRGAVLGFIASLPLVGMLLLYQVIDLRQFFINLSPILIQILTFNQPLGVGIAILIGIFILVGMIGAGIRILPEKYSSPVIAGSIAVFLIGLLSEVIILAWGTRGIGLAIRSVLFAARGLSLPGAMFIFIFAGGMNALWRNKQDDARNWVQSMPSRRQQGLRFGLIGFLAFLLLILPFILRTYFTEVTNNVVMYVLMGMGLNIVVGFAGLLDLGYVAFFAIGAYTMGALTTQGELATLGLSFWGALPLAVLAAVTAGIILGIPVLRMRGDYLAIVTLGFGEIIRILALSDALAPLIGGAQGILKIPRPTIGSFDFGDPESLYYIFLVGAIITTFITWRLQDSRTGRQWMAMREDEDVAEAMGISLVRTKLLAFAIGAAFSGLAGAIFASKLGSIFPHSFNLIVSINVLCLIILGGIGSIPGVFVGALVLIGLPELLREFAEYRLLFYGALLIVMMLARPEGFVPSAVRKRELHADEDDSIVQEELYTAPMVQEPGD
jgi:branched-chain amino acid transport system permease protein